MERPHLHIIASSDSSTKDQLRYIAERVDELKTLETVIGYKPTEDSRERYYSAIARLFSGK